MYKNYVIHNFIKFIFLNYNYKNNNGSEILGFLNFLPFSLPELTASPTICCCIVVRSGCKTSSETELGPCPPNCKLTAESASSGSVEVSVKTDRQFIL